MKTSEKMWMAVLLLCLALCVAGVAVQLVRGLQSSSADSGLRLQVLELRVERAELRVQLAEQNEQAMAEEINGISHDVAVLNACACPAPREGP